MRQWRRRKKALGVFSKYAKICKSVNISKNNNTNLKIFQFLLTIPYGMAQAKKPSHATVPLNQHHCKDKMPKILNKYFQKRNIGAPVPISTFMCLWANYIFPRWVCLFCWRKYVDWSWEYINRSKTHEGGNWGWGRAIPIKGVYKRTCRCSVQQKTDRKEIF